MEEEKRRYEQEYRSRMPGYERLGDCLKQSLSAMMKEANVETHDIQYRVKQFESFYEKIDRKGYTDPYNETEDICGVRVICYYPSDLDKITESIKREFLVLEETDKADLLTPDRFGYRSIHFIVTLKPEWLNIPGYRGLNGLKAEIQIRTILMHAWADVEHKLAYKKKEHIPDHIQRKLYQLSALFEVADEQFDGIRKQREEYREELLNHPEQFDLKQALNLDSLQAFLDCYFPDRAKHDGLTSSLLDELIEYDVNLEDLYKYYMELKEDLPTIEAVTIEEAELDFPDGVLWNQVGLVRNLLEYKHEKYWRDREAVIPQPVVDIVDKIKKIISK